MSKSLFHLIRALEAACICCLSIVTGCSDDSPTGPAGKPRAWTIVKEPAGDNYYGVWISPTGDVFVVGDNGTALRSGDGNTWDDLTTGVTGTLRGVFGTSSSDVYAVGFDSTMVHFDGASWSPFTPPAGVSLFGITITPDGGLFVVGDEGLRAQWVNGAWDATMEPSSAVFGVWGSARDDVFAVGNGGVRHYDGNSWAIMPEDAASPLFDVWGTSGSNVYAVGFDGAIIHYDGHQWTSMDSGQEPGHLRALRGVWGASTSYVLAVGGYNLWGDEAGAYDGVIDRFDGRSWKVQEYPSTLNLGDVFGRGNVVYAVGDKGVIVRY